MCVTPCPTRASEMHVAEHETGNNLHLSPATHDLIAQNVRSVLADRQTDDMTLGRLPISVTAHRLRPFSLLS